MKTGIRVLLLTLVLSSCTDYPTNEYSGSGYYGPPLLQQSHTIPNPMGIRAPVGKWLPVIAGTVATESKGRFRFRTFGCSLEQQPMQDPTDLLEWRESKNTHYPQIYPHKTAKY